MTAALLEQPQTIVPGVFENVPMSVYQSWDCASSHRLHALKRSPMHCRWEIDAPDECTPALMLGRLVNAMLLEPETVLESFAVAERCCATTAKGSRCTNNGKVRVTDGGVWVCGVHAREGVETDTVDVVSPEQFAIAGACTLAIKAHPAASALVEQRTDTELSLVWRDEETDQLCKARPDFLIRPSILTDLKTCRDASRRAFEKAIFEYGYQTQAAMYRNGLRAHGIEIKDAALICVETDPPHAVAVYQFEDDVMDRGEREVKRLLKLYEKCARSGEWPGFSDAVEWIGLPAWARDDETL